MCFLYLISGHLFGDFVLQTNKIAANKHMDRKWTLLHVIIVTLFLMVFAYPFGTLVQAMVLLNGAFHYYIDRFKLKINLKNRRAELVYFLLDQSVHVAVLAVISIFSQPKNNLLFLNQAEVYFLLVILFISFFSSVLNQFILRALVPDSENLFFRDGENYVGVFFRVAVTISLFQICFISVYYVAFLILAFIFIFYVYLRKWSRWMGRKFFALKLIFDLAASGIGLIMLWMI